MINKVYCVHGLYKKRKPTCAFFNVEAYKPVGWAVRPEGSSPLVIEDPPGRTAQPTLATAQPTKL